MKASEELPRLKAANLPRATFAGLFAERGDGEPWSAEDKAAIDAYLAAFVQPTDAGKCACCGTVQGGLMGALLGGFTWGIANGEGFCGACGYPGRALHRNVGGIEFFQFILQYHPDSLEKAMPEQQRGATACGCSPNLSYWRVADRIGIEPMTSCLRGRRYPV